MRRWIRNHAFSMSLAGLALVAALVVGLFVVPSPAQAAPVAQEDTPTTPNTDTYTPEPGLLVLRVAPDSPAAAAGIVRGDIILAVNGDPVNTMAEATFLLRTLQPGDTVELTVRHGDEERTVEVTLGDRNGRAYLGVLAIDDLHVDRAFGRQGRQDRQNRWATPRGFRGGPERMPFHGFGMPYFQAPGRAAVGAVVVDVAADSPAAAAELRPGDVITAVDAQPIRTAQDLVEAVRSKAPGDTVTLEVTGRDGTTRTVEVTLGEHPDDPEMPYLGVQVTSGPMGLPFRGGPGMWGRPWGDQDMPMQPWRQTPPRTPDNQGNNSSAQPDTLSLMNF